MHMIFRHGFFHADPHPSNIMVLEATEQIGLIDFGMVGKLTDEDMSRLTGLFIDAVSERIEALPKRLAALGVRYPKDLEEEFVAELRDVYYRYYGSSLSEIDPIQLIREAFALIYRMHLQLPTRFVLLDRAIATLGSVGMELYPDFNVFDVAKPYARELMIERFTPQRIARRTGHELRHMASMLHELPYQVHDTLEQVRDGQIEVGFRHQGLEDLIRAWTSSSTASGSRWSRSGARSPPRCSPWSRTGSDRSSGSSRRRACLSAFLSIWLVWSVLRSGRL